MVVHANGKPPADTQAILADPFGAELMAQVTDGDGRARFAGISPGCYELRTSRASGPPLRLPVSVTGALFDRRGRG